MVAGSWITGGRKSRVMSAHTLREQHEYTAPGLHVGSAGHVPSTWSGACRALESDRYRELPHWSAGEGLASVGRRTVMAVRPSTAA